MTDRRRQIIAQRAATIAADVRAVLPRPGAVRVRVLPPELDGLAWEPVTRPPWWKRPFLSWWDRLPSTRLTPESRRRLDEYVDAQLARHDPRLRARLANSSDRRRR